MSNTVSRRPPHPKQFWAEHIQCWRDSGLSKAAYCKTHSLNSGNFYNWCSKLAKDSTTTPRVQAESTLKPLTLLPVSVDPSLHSTATVEVKRGHTVILLPTDLDPAIIARWLNAIHPLHV